MDCLISFADVMTQKKFETCIAQFDYPLSSKANNLAMLSHYIHTKGNGDINPYQKKALSLIDEILSLQENVEIDSSNKLIVNEPEFQYNLFSDLFEVPFPTPRNAELKYIDLFAGMGGIRVPFDELGYQCVFSSEWDAKACETYYANFGVVPFGDITKIHAEDIPHHDVLLAGFPCQAFSIMGKMQGFADTRGTMFFEIERILKYHKTPYILLENVKQLVGHDGGRTFKVILERLSDLGYYVKWQVLNALDFGLPQKRERVIIVGFLDKNDCDAFSFDVPHIQYNLSSILENDSKVDKSLFASEHIVKRRQEQTLGKEVFFPSIWHENKAGNVSVLDYSCALRTGASYNYLLVNGIRRPTSRELLRLQGFPEKFRIVVSHQDIRRQTGNSVAVPMIRMVAQNINNVIKSKKHGTSKAQRLKEVADA